MRRLEIPQSDCSAIRLVSEDGVKKLERFAELVCRWTTKINLVSRSTIPELWDRHIVDSVQLFSCANEQQRLWLDIGSGGGFPGIVIAVLAEEFTPKLGVTLVESDKRKSVFLSEACRQLGLAATVHCQRSENLAPQAACVVSARALAPLTQLCAHAERHLRSGGTCAFLKGASADDEVVEARKLWKFDLDRLESLTDKRSSVLFLKGLGRV
ncbi:MAG: 16S rRNA (guanine(527)-N(7))-methyltransferase RsmG [Rhodobacteraceae bacterium]|nr:16S rRNA (guanine(527)-N(7))-methyltransferase RsmG [Paracoccaceae bacterium]